MEKEGCHENKFFSMAFLWALSPGAVPLADEGDLRGDEAEPGVDVREVGVCDRLTGFGSERAGLDGGLNTAVDRSVRGHECMGATPRGRQLKERRRGCTCASFFLEGFPPPRPLVEMGGGPFTRGLLPATVQRAASAFSVGSARPNAH